MIPEMYSLVILADDFTGALDTGVQFSKHGVATMVTSNIDCGFEDADSHNDVLVINQESRHLTPQEAYHITYSIAKRAFNAGVSNIYKKTDSALRGNIGSELAAVVDAANGKSLAFIPAFPRINRITRAGIQYIDGIPVTKSVFGKDPFEPVLSDNIEEIIHAQSDKRTLVTVIGHDNYFDFDKISDSIVIFDAESNKDMELIARSIGRSKKIIAAGCAGFVEELLNLLNIKPQKRKKISIQKGIIILSGSVNDITLRQTKLARENGFPYLSLRPEEKLSDDIEYHLMNELGDRIKNLYGETQRIIIEATRDTAGFKETEAYAYKMGLAPHETRKKIAYSMGCIAHWISRNLTGNIVIFGGDVLQATINAIGSAEIFPLLEIDNGVALSMLEQDGKNIYLISKSGGFGENNVIMKIEEFLNSKQEELKI